MDKPSTLEEIYAQNRYWERRRDRAQARARAAEKTAEQALKHLGVRLMVEQLRDLMQPYFPDHKLEVLGPFGLSHETAIHANVDDPDERRGYRIVGSLTFRPAHVYTDVRGNHLREPGMMLRLVDRTRTVNEYPATSIGGMNGFNYPEVELPPTVKEIAQLLGDSIRVDAQ